MADLTARLNTVYSWTSAGVGDKLICQNISPGLRTGVQVEINGVNLDTATIVCFGETGAQKTVASVAQIEEIALIGEGFSISRIEISGVAAGTYSIKFSQ